MSAPRAARAPLVRPTGSDAAARAAPAAPTKSVSRQAGYSGTPLPKKLGIKEGSTVFLIGAPTGFEKTLGELPAGARLVRRAVPRAALTLWFPASRRELERDVRKRGAAATEAGGLWIAWIKMSARATPALGTSARRKDSREAADLTETLVRNAGLANGLVDFKICAIDATWSGLRFARRRSTR